MTNKLEGKVALVTGCAGTGFAAAEALVAQGARVFISGASQPELDAAVVKIGGGVTALRGNPADLGDVDHVLSTVRRRAGRLDVLVIDACINDRRTLEMVTEAEFDRSFNTNVRGLLFTVQTALPLLADGASVVLLGVKDTGGDCAGFSVAGAAHAAVRAFARAWSTELKHRNISVTVASDSTGGHLSFVASLI
jgi:NAD(P)-dependent dehydrogenase (short-subunit alcohol dehydrogenase family)